MDQIHSCLRLMESSFCSKNNKLFTVHWGEREPGRGRSREGCVVSRSEILFLKIYVLKMVVKLRGNYEVYCTYHHILNVSRTF